jgi:hypothetical protein
MASFGSIYSTKRISPHRITLEIYVILKHAPLAVFQTNRTPAGPYARSRQLRMVTTAPGRSILKERLRRSTRDSSGTAAGRLPPDDSRQDFFDHKLVNSGID